MSRFQIVADNSTTFEVKRLCELVDVTRSSYYAWRAAAPARAERQAADAAFADRVRAVQAHRRHLQRSARDRRAQRHRHHPAC